MKKKEEKEGKRMSVKDFNLGKDGLRRQGEGTELKKKKTKEKSTRKKRKEKRVGMIEKEKGQGIQNEKGR
jgi:hypothetical protein